MSASSRGSFAVLAFTRGASPSCQRSITRRQITSHRCYSASATATVPETTDAAPPNPTSTTRAPRSVTTSQYKIKSGIILSRPPLLTRAPTKFESSFYLYQKRLNERLTAPFRRQLYFKRDTLPELDWKIKVGMRRGTNAKDIGVYKGQGRNAWNDEVLIGSDLDNLDRLRMRLVRDAEMRVSEDGELLVPADRTRVERPMPRRTEADEAGDTKRLDRALDRTLYLLVRNEQGWGFPAADVTTDEALHETAARALASAAGVNMNTWIVGRAPIAHLVTKPVVTGDNVVETKGEKTFLLKGRIMAGQADLTDNTLGLTDFKWVTNEELKEALSPFYYHSVRNMMAER